MATNRLLELGVKYRTQKVQHGFLEIYERYFHDLKNVRLLEIGVAEGASMKMWQEYFSNGYIYGVDKILNFKTNLENVFLSEGDICDKSTIDKLGNLVFDIIIDDGSHIASEQLKAFDNLWDLLRPGGLYIVEDLFTLYDPEWNDQNENSIIDELYLRTKDILVNGDSIQEVHLYGRNDINGLLIMRKRKEEFRIQPLSEFNVF